MNEAFNKEITLPDLHCTVEGRYMIEAVRILPDGTEERRTLAPWFKNLIVDNGLEMIGNSGSNDILLGCLVGTGNTAPANSDSNLKNYVTGTNNRTSSTFAWVRNEGSGVRYVQRRMTWRFPQGAAAGNLAEVGISSGVTNANLFSRALIVDGSGNPTTITVTAIDFLDVTYEFRWNVPIVQAVDLGTFTIPGSGDHSVKRYNWGIGGNLTGSSNTGAGAGWGTCPRMAYGTNAGNATYGLSANEPMVETSDSPQTDLGRVDFASPDAYVAGSHKLTCTATADVSTGNGSIRTVAITGVLASAFQYRFEPVIVKNNTQTLTLKFGVTWSRA